MNERIQKLAVQAGFSGEGFHNTQVNTCQETALKNFAQLIVQECIDIVTPYTVRMSRPGEEYLHPIQEIRKNFGVEE
jgi:hypothetical protein